jgi:RNA polymerase sigma factor (sigma-70 family)
MYLKKNKRRKFLPLLDLDVFLPHLSVGKGPTIYEQAEQQEMKELIDAGFTLLDQKYKEPIALYYGEGFSYKEIADILQVPMATIGVRIKRGKEALKRIFQQKGYTHEYQ